MRICLVELTALDKNWSCSFCALGLVSLESTLNPFTSPSPPSAADNDRLNKSYQLTTNYAESAGLKASLWSKDEYRPVWQFFSFNFARGHSQPIASSAFLTVIIVTNQLFDWHDLLAACACNGPGDCWGSWKRPFSWRQRGDLGLFGAITHVSAR